MVILWRWGFERDRVEVAIVVKMNGDLPRTIWKPKVAPCGVHWGGPRKGNFHRLIVDKAVPNLIRLHCKDCLARGCDLGVCDMIFDLTRDPPRPYEVAQLTWGHFVSAFHSKQAGNPASKAIKTGEFVQSSSAPPCSLPSPSLYGLRHLLKNTRL